VSYLLLLEASVTDFMAQKLTKSDRS